MSERPLTPKQQRFVDAYKGNATEAARAAGYAGDDNALGVAGSRLLRDVRIAAAIRARQDTEPRPYIATRQERQRFWTETMLDVGAEMSARLKASELLGKSEADFTEKVEHSGALTLEQLVLGSMEKP